jgi:hypothetical protein
MPLLENPPPRHLDVILPVFGVYSDVLTTAGIVLGAQFWDVMFLDKTARAGTMGK